VVRALDPRALTAFVPPRRATVWQAPPCVSHALDIDLFERLREILAGGDTTESELRELADEASGWVRGLRAQVRASEQRLRALNRDPAASLTDIADELRRAETLRPQYREARELARRLDDRARELRTTWLLRQADVRRAS
jgi:ABC-type transporter Mla subunit MlaD